MSADPRSLLRWRRNPIVWVERYLIDPETGKPFKLLEAEKHSRWPLVRTGAFCIPS